MKIKWQKFDESNMENALSQSHCLYVFHHPDDGDRPYYIGKAKHFGTKQSDGYNGNARYNSGYIHLIAGLLRSGFNIYIASIGINDFDNAESYEQCLIEKWNPIRPQKRNPGIIMDVNSNMPWLNNG